MRGSGKHGNLQRILSYVTNVIVRKIIDACISGEIVSVSVKLQAPYAKTERLPIKRLMISNHTMSVNTMYATYLETRYFGANYEKKGKTYRP